MALSAALSLRSLPDTGLKASRGKAAKLRSARVTRCVASDGRGDKSSSDSKVCRGRREIVLNSSAALVLGGLLDGAIGGLVEQSKPSLGLRQYGDVITLSLCPPKPNCVSTAEDLNDDSHYIPPWTYNPDDGRGLRDPATQAQAMEELVEVVTNTDCDGFEVNIVQRLDDYLYVEYKDPRFGFVDDVEFFFAPGDRSRVEYRTAGAWTRRRVQGRLSESVSKRSGLRCRRRGGSPSVSEAADATCKSKRGHLPTRYLSSTTSTYSISPLRQRTPCAHTVALPRSTASPAGHQQPSLPSHRTSTRP